MECPRENTRICKVCNAKAESAHYGVHSCRACAAFFKRTVLSAQKHICRQNKQSCDVSKDIRFTCRSCRFVKCLAVGMNPEGVPNTRRNRRLNGEARKAPAKPVSESPEIELGSSSQSESAPSPKIERPSMLQSNPGTSQTALLDVIRDQYKLLENTAMRNDEKVMTDACGDKLQRRNGLVPGRIGLQNQCVRASLQSVIGFATFCFPEINDFSEDEKWCVLKNFMTSRFLFDSVYRAQKYFPGDNNIFMVSFLTFVEIDRIELYLTDLEDLYDKEMSIKMMRAMTSKCTSEWLGPLLKSAVIDEVETAAVYGLLCWPAYLSSSSDRVKEISYKYHLRIFQELNNHYKKIGKNDYSSRVSHISSILMCVQAAIQRLKEDMQIYRLLDVYSGNELVFDVIR